MSEGENVENTNDKKAGTPEVTGIEDAFSWRSPSAYMNRE